MTTDNNTAPTTTSSQAELDLGVETSAAAVGETPARPQTPPTPIGLLELQELGRKVEALGKAMQDPDADLQQLVALSADCGLAMHIEIVDRGEPAAAPASGDTDTTTER